MNSAPAQILAVILAFSIRIAASLNATHLQDLHSLLATGRLSLTVKNRTLELASVQLFLMSERLLTIAEDVLDIVLKALGARAGAGSGAGVGTTTGTRVDAGTG